MGLPGPPNLWEARVWDGRSSELGEGICRTWKSLQNFKLIGICLWLLSVSQRTLSLSNKFKIPSLIQCILSLSCPWPCPCPSPFLGSGSVVGTNLVKFISSSSFFFIKKVISLKKFFFNLFIWLCQVLLQHAGSSFQDMTTELAEKLHLVSAWRGKKRHSYTK